MISVTTLIHCVPGIVIIARLHVFYRFHVFTIILKFLLFLYTYKQIVCLINNI